MNVFSHAVVVVALEPNDPAWLPQENIYRYFVGGTGGAVGETHNPRYLREVLQPLVVSASQIGVKEVVRPTAPETLGDGVFHARVDARH